MLNTVWQASLSEPKVPSPLAPQKARHPTSPSRKAKAGALETIAMRRTKRRVKTRAKDHIASSEGNSEGLNFAIELSTYERLNLFLARAHPSLADARATFSREGEKGEPVDF
jgi:hypothetical protein